MDTENKLQEQQIQEPQHEVSTEQEPPKLFNREALYNAAMRPIFVTVYDPEAQAIIEAGHEAVSLSNHDTVYLLQELDNRRPVNTLILCNEGDRISQMIIDRLAGDLQEMGIPFVSANVAGQYETVADAAEKDKVLFISELENAEYKADPEGKGIIENDAAQYMESGKFALDIQYFKKYKDRKIGFAAIDKYLTLYPGLAALGGQSSLGKTTFAVNIADKLLKKGETILFFSLEQLPIEIITKILAKRLYELDPTSRLTNTQIKNGASSPELEQVKKEFAGSSESKNLKIITCNFRTTAADITGFVEAFMERNKGIKPIVIIDYLQLIAPPRGFKGGVRETTDENVKALKDMQKRNGLFVIMISNFNRSSNQTPVNYEAFKETSMIEYTCDYVWGLQLSIQASQSFYVVKGPKGGAKERPIDEKIKMIHEAQKATPKKVELVSLKNRNGKQSFEAFFDYYPEHDVFMEDLDGDAKYKGTAGAFEELPFDTYTPFNS